MRLLNGYTMTTTFPEDFTIADRFGIEAVKDTFKRAFNEWKHNPVYLAELVVVLNLKIWQHYKDNEPLARIYDSLWRKAHNYALDTFEGDDFTTYYKIVD